MDAKAVRGTVTEHFSQRAVQDFFSPFPFIVVRAGLDQNPDYWAGLSLAWFAGLDANSQLELAESQQRAAVEIQLEAVTYLHNATGRIRDLSNNNFRSGVAAGPSLRAPVVNPQITPPV